VPGNGFQAILAGMEGISEHHPVGEIGNSTLSRNRFDWYEQFEQLKRHVQRAETEHGALYAKSLASLLEVFALTFGDPERESLDANKTAHLPFAWLYCIDNELINLAQQHDAVPLILLAYFALLLKNLDSHWWIQGWAEHIARSAQALVPESYGHWMNWAMDHINEK
jgi:hypothetical protein